MADDLADYHQSFIDRAQEAIACSTDENDDQTRLMDLICHLRHWADARGLDFYGAVDASYEHYLEERQWKDERIRQEGE